MTTLAELDSKQRELAECKWKVLRPHVEDGVPSTGPPVRPASHCVARSAGSPATEPAGWLVWLEPDGLTRGPGTSPPSWSE